MGTSSATKPKTKRLAWIDVAKGICMLSIIAGHINFVNCNGNNALTPLVFQFHIPVFYIIAGFFLNTSKSLKEFITDRFSRLVGPYIATSGALLLILLFIRITTGRINPPSIWNRMLEFILSVLWGAGYHNATLPEGVGIIGAIWFLEALFVAVVEVRYLIEHLRYEISIAMAITILAIASLLTRDLFFLPFNIQPGLVGGLYVYIGHLYHTHFGLRIRHDSWLQLILFSVMALSYVSDTYVSLVGPSFSHGIFGFASSICASYLILSASVSISNSFPGLSNLLRFFGRNSLPVLCIHLCCMNLGFRLLSNTMLGMILEAPPHNLVSLVNLMLQLAVIVVFILTYQRAMHHSAEKRIIGKPRG